MESITDSTDNDALIEIFGRFISETKSDTIYDCIGEVRCDCLKDSIIKFDTLYACKWSKIVKGGCSPGQTLFDSIYDTCYNKNIHYYEK
jgi:hypothetical protein